MKVVLHAGRIKVKDAPTSILDSESLLGPLPKRPSAWDGLGFASEIRRAEKMRHENSDDEDGPFGYPGFGPGPKSVDREHSESESVSSGWRCAGCGNIDMSCLEENRDRETMCTKCGAVLHVCMKSLYREKACSASEDGTVRADLKWGFERAEDVTFETCKETRERRRAAACATQVGMAAKRKLGIDHALHRVSADVEREMQSESCLGKAGEKKLSAIAPFLAMCIKAAYPVHDEVHEYARDFLFKVVKSATVHSQICGGNGSGLCSIDLVSKSNRLIALYSFRACLKILVDTHGTDACPVSSNVEISSLHRLELVARTLEIKGFSDQQREKVKHVVGMLSAMDSSTAKVSCMPCTVAAEAPASAGCYDQGCSDYACNEDDEVFPSSANLHRSMSGETIVPASVAIGVSAIAVADKICSVSNAVAGMCKIMQASPACLARAMSILQYDDVASTIKMDFLPADAVAVIIMRVSVDEETFGTCIKETAHRICTRHGLSYSSLESRVSLYRSLVEVCDESSTSAASADASDDLF